MYNLLISLGIGLALFAVTGLIGGNWLAGIIPATIGLGVAYFLLARRSGQQLQAIMERAMAEFNALEKLQPPRTQREATRMQKLQRDKLASGRAIIEEGFKLTRWQFLIDSQIHAQLGSLEYMQQNYTEAVVHLEKAWNRHWQAQAMLACIDFREKRHDEALVRMEKADGPGGSDTLFWAIYIWIAYKAGKRDQALTIANQAVKKHEDSNSLKAMATAIANKRPLRPDAFAPGWYQFFPEDMPQAKEMAKNAKKHGNAPNVRRGGYSFPHPKR